MLEPFTTHGTSAVSVRFPPGSWAISQGGAARLNALPIMKSLAENPLTRARCATPLLGMAIARCVAQS